MTARERINQLDEQVKERNAVILNLRKEIDELKEINDKKNIIILSFARTGSNYISSLIANNNKERINSYRTFSPKGMFRS